MDAVEAGIKDAKEIAGSGTPTVIVNGSRMRGAPDSATLEKVVDDILKAKPSRRAALP